MSEDTKTEISFTKEQAKMIVKYLESHILGYQETLQIILDELELLKAFKILAQEK